MQLSLTPLSYIKYKSGNKLHAVSVLKLLMALMVIQIHTPSSWRAFSMPLLRIAVPVFFMISGYFILLDNGTFSLSRISKSIRKIGLIILSANIVYLALYATVLYRHGQDIIAELSSIRLWIDAIFLGGSFGFHLWYLTAFMETLIVIFFAVKFHKEKILFWLVPIGLLLNLLTGGYSFLVTRETLGIDWSRNFLTVGIPCVMAGVLLRRNEHRIRIHSSTLMILVVIALAALYLEWMIVGNVFYSRGNVFLLTLPLAFLVFYSSLKATGHLANPNILASFGEKYSLDIYIYHLLAITIMEWAISKEYSSLYGLIIIPFTVIVIAGVQVYRTTCHQIVRLVFTTVHKKMDGVKN